MLKIMLHIHCLMARGIIIIVRVADLIISCCTNISRLVQAYRPKLTSRASIVDAVFCFSETDPENWHTQTGSIRFSSFQLLILIV